MSRMTPLIFISACEPSGDLLGAELIAALVKLHPDGVDIHGIGGGAMASQGGASIFATDGLAVMGFGDVVPALRKSRRLARRAAASIDQLKPDVLVTIDSMGFHKQLVTLVRTQNPGVKIVHYGAPKYWAWWPGRAKRIRGLFDQLLCLFPFEPAFFSRFGLPCTFVGHPVVNRMSCGTFEADELKMKLAIPEDAPVVVLLPGSRGAEVNRLMPVFSETLQILRQTMPDLVTMIPSVPPMAERISRTVGQWEGVNHVITGETQKVAAFHLGEVALAASGTVSLELAACNLPQITTYKVGPVSAVIARRLIRTKHVNLVNILSDTPVVPEHIQQDCRPDILARSVLDMLANRELRERQRGAYAKVLEDLGGRGPPPSERAALAIMQHFLPSGL